LKRWNYHLSEDDGHANPSKDDINAYHEETLPNMCLITHGLVAQDLCVAKFQKCTRGQKQTSIQLGVVMYICLQ
jgi:hypothetical protein